MKRKEQLLTLAAEIEEELKQIHRLVQEIEENWSKKLTAPSEFQKYLLESAALKLQTFYTACERIFEKIAADVNGAVPQSHDWHMRLLRTMAIDIKGVRPLVLSPSLVSDLEEFLKFRHLVRIIYAFELDEIKMGPLVEKVPAVGTRFITEIENFISYVKSLAQSLTE